MVNDITSPRSRRALLGAGLGAIAAAVTGVVGRSAVTEAANGDPMLLGHSMRASLVTQVQTTDVAAISGVSHSGPGIYGDSQSDRGVWGRSGTAAGVYGQSAHGPCIHGETTGNFSHQPAVLGVSMPAGYGVKGLTETGVGVFAKATAGNALQVDGRAVFSRSGRATIAAGAVSVSVDVDDGMGASSLVLATIQGDISGTLVRGVLVDIAQRRFTIYLNKTAPSDLEVGWFIVN